MLPTSVHMGQPRGARRGLAVIRALSLISAVLALILIDPQPALMRPRTASGNSHPGSAAPFERIHLAKEYGRLPLSFEVNEGQADAGVKLLSRGSHYTLSLTANEAVLLLPESSAIRDPRSHSGGPKAGPRVVGSESRSPTFVRLKMIGASPAPKVSPMEELPGKNNYIIGNDPKKWRTNIPTYAKVKYEGVYPGVDLVYYGNQGRLEYDFVVAPRADPSAIRLRLDGPQEIRLDHKTGDLVLRSGRGELRFQKPLIYQMTSFDAGPSRDARLTTTQKEPIKGGYALVGKNEIAFSVAGYDPTRPLVIDPVLSYSTYLGGDAEPGGQANAIAVDGAGNAYVTGSVGSSDFPTTAGAFQPGCAQPAAAGCPVDGFVAKLNPEGTALVYSTFLGGSNGQTFAHAIAVDASGNAYVTGSTSASDYSTTVGSYQPGAAPHVSVSSVFVTKLNADGSGPAYSTYLGDSGGGAAIAVDGFGSAYVAGSTYSLDFPTTSGAFQTSCKNAVTGGCNGNAFVSKLDPEGSALIYSTYLGGSSTHGDAAAGIAVDSIGNAYLTGATHSSDFPVTPGAYQLQFVGGQCEVVPPPRTTGPVGTRICSDAFVTKLNATGSGLVYSTFLAGSMDDSAIGIAVDAAGSATVAGTTASPDFPTTPGAFQPGSGSVFVTKLDPAGTALVHSTRLGGSKSDSATGLALDVSGDAYVTGQVLSTDFPTANPIQAQNAGGNGDAFVAVFNPLGTKLLFSTYLGGSSDDVAQGIAVDGSGNAYVAGHTDSGDFKVTSGALRTTSQVVCQVGSNPIVGYSAPCGSMFVTKIGLGLGRSAEDFSLSASPASATIVAGRAATYTLNISPFGGFNQTVALACAGAPQGTMCSVSPASLTMEGSASAVASVTVTTTARSTASPHNSPRLIPPANGVRPWTALLSFLGLAMLAGLSLASRRPLLPGRRRVNLIAAPVLFLVIFIGTLACGGGSTIDPPGGKGDPGTPAGTYTLMVSGTSTSGSLTLTHGAALTLNVH